MLSTPRGYRGMVTAPHHLASQAGLEVLREGGNAVEAMIAMAAAIPVVYPHMNAIGGDGFWLIDAGDGRPVAGIDACGAAASILSPTWYKRQGHETIPSRGPLAANTVAGTVSGWGAAYEIAKTGLTHSVFSKLALLPAFLYFNSKKKTELSVNSMCFGYQIVATKL
jgi:gamma-glutamyltranspeptidase/glutathione hydrolase